MVNQIKDVLKYGKDMLSKNDISTREARMLLALAMNISSNDLIKYTECPEGEFTIYKSFIERRCSGEPYAYIVGKKEFMKLDFLVNKNVLIPREDTEILVLEAIKRCPQKILDMCTGSGCIAISLAKYINGAEVDAVDISSPALTVAKKNAKLNEVDVKFIKSDLFENIEEKFDIIAMLWIIFITNLFLNIIFTIKEIGINNLFPIGLLLLLVYGINMMFVYLPNYISVNIRFIDIIIGLPLDIKLMFYLHVIIHLPLHIIYGCFKTTTAELSGCCRDPQVYNIYYLALYRKSLLTTDLKGTRQEKLFTSLQ